MRRPGRGSAVCPWDPAASDADRLGFRGGRRHRAWVRVLAARRALADYPELQQLVYMDLDAWFSARAFVLPAAVLGGPAGLLPGWLPPDTDWGVAAQDDYPLSLLCSGFFAVRRSPVALSFLKRWWAEGLSECAAHTNHGAGDPAGDQVAMNKVVNELLLGQHRLSHGVQCPRGSDGYVWSKLQGDSLAALRGTRQPAGRRRGPERGGGLLRTGPMWAIYDSWEMSSRGALRRQLHRPLSNLTPLSALHWRGVHFVGGGADAAADPMQTPPRGKLVSGVATDEEGIGYGMQRAPFLVYHSTGGWYELLEPAVFVPPTGAALPEDLAAREMRLYAAIRHVMWQCEQFYWSCARSEVSWRLAVPRPFGCLPRAPLCGECKRVRLEGPRQRRRGAPALLRRADWSQDLRAIWGGRPRHVFIKHNCRRSLSLLRSLDADPPYPGVGARRTPWAA
eukprot:TRINITY_DN11546_c1_g2_i2.p1 TRINITY_DN11546_c1_g2~~TRINITY_DN11546_c1_g2_i2.p1  ORF type:complete len:450 (+),score=103.87 TRINITY_DN11546_c1_g2_i2:467-1816(+)